MTTLDFSLEELDVEHLHCKTAGFSFYGSQELGLGFFFANKNSLFYKPRTLLHCLKSLLSLRGTLLG
ncbi:hypothetical protein VPH35_072416 [Triticum aestivum]